MDPLTYLNDDLAQGFDVVAPPSEGTRHGSNGFNPVVRRRIRRSNRTYRVVEPRRLRSLPSAESEMMQADLLRRVSEGAMAEEGGVAVPEEQQQLELELCISESVTTEAHEPGWFQDPPMPLNFDEATDIYFTGYTEPEKSHQHHVRYAILPLQPFALCRCQYLTSCAVVLTYRASLGRGSPLIETATGLSG
jgi:hypothetical protein